MRFACQFLRNFAPDCRPGLVWLAVGIALLNCHLAHAEVHKCVGADGSVVYSDKPCEPAPQRTSTQTDYDPGAGLGAARDVPIVPADSGSKVAGVDHKIHELLLLTQLSARESPGVAELALRLIPRVDASFTADDPQDPRWNPLSRAIQSDIRADAPQLGRTFAEADQTLTRAVASQMQEADADALLSFARSPTGVSYLQFLGDMRAIYASAMRTVMGHVAAQTPISQAAVSSAAANGRLQLITIATGAASIYHAQDVAHGVHDPSPYAADGIHPEQIAAVASPGLDAIAERYETALADFETFSASSATRHFYAIVGPPVAAKAITTEAAMKDFTDAEFRRFGDRWRVAYQRGVYYVALVPGMVATGSGGPAPQIRRASYVSPTTARTLDVTRVVQSACAQRGGSCQIACGNQLAGDPDFGRTKFCQVAFQCEGHPVQNVTMAEGKTLTLACAR